jgi:hypothetical protein
MFQPVKVGFGEFMGRFYAGMAQSVKMNHTTKAMHEFARRGQSKAMAWAPGRMVDSAQAMLDAWQRSDTDPAPTQPAKLPVVIVAMADDYTPTTRDFNRQVDNSQWVIIPGDAKERAFGLRTVLADIRVQVAVFASEQPTASNISALFTSFLGAMENRRFYAEFAFAGIPMQWPVQIEDPGPMGVAVKDDENKNVKIVAVDLTLKATVPLFDAPSAEEPSDGKGIPGDPNDPAGYPVVVETVMNRLEPPR